MTMPLAARMRPRTLDEIVGQKHLVGEQGVLRQLVTAGRLPSMVLWGPSGVGKTTLAEVLCHQTASAFVRLSAVLSGVKEIREAVALATKNKQDLGVRTFVFVDEIHRFNRAQQDALLPHVEDGTITLIGATTENPSFSVNSPLLSRCRVFVLKPLEQEELLLLLQQALTEQERGFGSYALRLQEEAQAQLVAVSNGDARILLTILEIAADLAIAEHAQEITQEHVTTSVGRRVLVYDKAGDVHYDVISAFIKSLRGSDPDAACHYLARMLDAGEDPRFIVRRMVIFASEDIGNADPQAIQIAVAALHAFELVGLPEGTLTLTQAATYLACAPKSNAVIVARDQAFADVKKYGALSVPLHLCNAPTKLMKDLGYGKGYQYPHDYPENYVKAQYLPDQLAKTRYYVPTHNGYERFIAERMQKRAERK